MTVFCIGIVIAGMITGNEACAWICLTVACLLPILKLGFQWFQVIERETRRVGPAIDEEDFF